MFPGGVELKGADYTVVACLLREFREDQEADLRPKSYRTVPAWELAERLHIQEPTVRKHISRARQSLDEKYYAVHGVRLLPSAVIENVRGGYRLNPDLVIVPPATLAERHTSRKGTSQKAS
jgi:hypothetical protein